MLVLEKRENERKSIGNGITKHVALLKFVLPGLLYTMVGLLFSYNDYRNYVSVLPLALLMALAVKTQLIQIRKQYTLSA